MQRDTRGSKGHVTGIDDDETTGQGSTDRKRKAGINRREYLRVGAVAAAGLLGASSVMATSSAQQTAYATDFSEYAL